MHPWLWSGGRGGALSCYLKDLPQEGDGALTAPSSCLALANPSPEMRFELSMVDPHGTCLARRAVLQVTSESQV